MNGLHKETSGKTSTKQLFTVKMFLLVPKKTKIFQHKFFSCKIISTNEFFSNYGIQMSTSLQEENQEKIHQSLLVYDALIKRKPFLDNLSEGLEVFKIKTIISSYPKLFEKKFIRRTYPVNSCEIKEIIKTASPLGNHHNFCITWANY